MAWPEQLDFSCGSKRDPLFLDFFSLALKAFGSFRLAHT